MGSVNVEPSRESPRKKDGETWVKWAPWRKYEGDVEADGEVPEGLEDDERESSNRELKEEAKKDR
eukprot:11252195-Karenia_brevis.AAC.1